MCQHRIFKLFNLQEVKHTGVLAVALRITKTEINLAQDRDKFQNVVNSDMNPRALQNAGKFSTT
jgi:hypothetical protein